MLQLILRGCRSITKEVKMLQCDQGSGKFTLKAQNKELNRSGATT